MNRDPHGQLAEQIEAGSSDETACPVCGDSTGSYLAFHGFELRRCSSCELGYVDSRTVPRKRFDDGYLLDLLGGQARSVAFFERELPSLRRRLPLSGARVLDVGFGGGTFLGLLSREGAHAHGAEISEAACAHLCRRLPDAVVSPHAADLRSVPFPSESFDLVTFWDSLQYMEHPLTQLAAAHAFLEPGGILVLQVPRRDSQCLWYARQLHRAHPEMARAFLHLPAALFLFTETFLRRELERIGFEILDVHGYRPRLRPRFGWSAKSFVKGLVDEGYALLVTLSGRRAPVIVTARKRASFPGSR